MLIFWLEPEGDASFLFIPQDEPSNGENLTRMHLWLIIQPTKGQRAQPSVLS